MAYQLLISDLHLDESRPQHLLALKQLLLQHAGHAEALYVLGDLFETWIGDDDDNDFNLEAIAAFRQFSDSGSQLYFIHGNRDFLLGKDFCLETGGSLLPDGYIANFYGIKTLLMHGDSLCTQDTKYQAFRTMVRAPEWQQQMLAKPLDQRRMMAQMMRLKSQQNNDNKSENIMDVTPDEVIRVMQEASVNHLIHGHTHRPAVHEVDLNNGQGKRWVLGDWGELIWFIHADDTKGFELTSQPVAELLN